MRTKFASERPFAVWAHLSTNLLASNGRPCFCGNSRSTCHVRCDLPANVSVLELDRRYSSAAPNERSGQMPDRGAADLNVTSAHDPYLCGKVSKLVWLDPGRCFYLDRAPRALPVRLKNIGANEHVLKLEGGFEDRLKWAARHKLRRGLKRSLNVWLGSDHDSCRSQQPSPMSNFMPEFEAGKCGCIELTHLAAVICSQSRRGQCSNAAILDLDSRIGLAAGVMPRPPACRRIRRLRLRHWLRRPGLVE